MDEPKGKNDGSVQGKKYFSCGENYGMFVRQTQIKILDASPGKTSRTPSRENSNVTKPPARQKSDLSTPRRQKSDLSKNVADSKQETLSSVSEESKETGGSKWAPPRSRLPLPGSGRQPSFTNISRKANPINLLT